MRLISMAISYLVPIVAQKFGWPPHVPINWRGGAQALPAQ